MAALVNIWHHRRVAEASSKPCDICYKPTTSVLTTPDNKDYFYVCQGHLKDKSFCTPIVDEAKEAAKKKQAELEREIELIKQEYEEKLKKRKKSKDAKDTGKGSDKNEKNNVKDEEIKNAEEEKDAKINALTSKSFASSGDDVPRIYQLQKVFYQKRLDQIRNAEIAKRNRERLRNPSLFPSVPTGDLG